jgi:hypothetical protein
MTDLGTLLPFPLSGVSGRYIAETRHSANASQDRNCFRNWAASGITTSNRYWQLAPPSQLAKGTSETLTAAMTPLVFFAASTRALLIDADLATGTRQLVPRSTQLMSRFPMPGNLDTRQAVKADQTLADICNGTFGIGVDFN